MHEGFCFFKTGLPELEDNLPPPLSAIFVCQDLYQRNLVGVHYLLTIVAASLQQQGLREELQQAGRHAGTQIG